MRHLPPWSRPVVLFGLLATVIGCQPAHPYSPRSASTAARPAAPGKTAAPTLPPEHDWTDPGRDPVPGDLPIEFVHRDANPKEWQALKAFWNDPGLAKPGEKPGPVRIKVPLGLDDPRPHLPAANPPTRHKWELGRRLFFDPSWLTDQGDVSCATCHVPAEAFTDSRKTARDTVNTLTLVNVVYQPRLFWDGRARYLEEVVQARPEDERAPAEPGPFRHSWPGVIRRLRSSKSHVEQFNLAMGVLPTQDAVGKAMATYLRTLLAGDALHDRAVEVQRTHKARGLTAEHYAAVLDADALARLGRPKGVKAVVATDLERGYTLFQGKAGCAGCHPAGGTFSDGRFHNIGLSRGDREDLGRFAVAPIGERDRLLRGAYRTPTLRTLLRTAPYFHDGSERDLEAVVRFHVRPRGRSEPFPRYLSPKLATPDGDHRDFGLSDEDIQVIGLFLRSLDGDEVDLFMRTNR